jgi:hypothetical protein
VLDCVKGVFLLLVFGSNVRLCQFDWVAYQIFRVNWLVRLTDCLSQIADGLGANGVTRFGLADQARTVAGKLGQFLLRPAFAFTQIAEQISVAGIGSLQVALRPSHRSPRKRATDSN